jgi:hypothetical protein
MRFDNLKNWWRGCDCVVVGGGPSGTHYALTGPVEHHWTIGCNRSVHYVNLRPDFAVIIDDHNDPVWEDVKPWRVAYYFTPHPPHKKLPKRLVQIGNFDADSELAPEDRRDLLRMPTLHIAQSPFYALAVATYLGFDTVGLIGVDLTEDRWPKVDGINRAYGELVQMLGTEYGTRFINLSPDSRLEAIPQGSWEDVRTK